MPPKKPKKLKPFEKLQLFEDYYKLHCERYGVEPIEEVLEVYDEAILKKSKKQPMILQFAENEVSPDRIRPLIESYQNTDVKIKILSFLNTKSGDVGLHVLAHALEPPLEIVGIAYHANEVGPSGCRAIARGFVNSQFLAILELDFNPGIADEGVAGLSHYGHCPTLTRLSLNFCNIGDKGAEHLALWLAKPECKITELLLKGNKIGPPGATVIGRHLPQNRSLNRIDLSDNIFGFDANCLNALHDGIAGCRPLKGISLLNNFECPEGLAEKFLKLVESKPLGEFELTVKMDPIVFQNIRAISLSNAKKIAKEAKKKGKGGGDNETEVEEGDNADKSSEVSHETTDESQEKSDEQSEAKTDVSSEPSERVSTASSVK